MAINTRVFGTPIKGTVKAKLEQRQQDAEQVKFGESLSFHGQQPVRNPINIPKSGELSSRTPFVRMWTGVKLIDPAIVGAKAIELSIADVEDGGGEIEFIKKINQGQIVKRDNLGTVFITPKLKRILDKDNNLESYELHDDFARDQIDIARKIYQIGNHTYQEAYGEFNPNNPLGSGLQQTPVPQDPNTSQQQQNQNKQDASTNVNKIFPNELQKNPLLKPQSGIISMTSDTKGALGLVKETTVEFMVHNFFDFDTIYNKYFLKPGATIFVDYGWNTINDLYEPSELLNSIQETGGIVNYLFGDDGIISENEGDFDVLQGVVTDYNAKVESNGSVRCSVTLTSANSTLLGFQTGEAENLRIKQILTKGIMFIGLGALLSTPDLLEELSEYRKSSQQDDLSDNDALRELIQLLNTPNADSSVEEFQKYDENIQKLAIKQFSNTVGPKGNQIRAGIYIDSGTKNNVYVSWGRIEDLIINSQFGFGKSDEDIANGDNLQVRLDSSNQFTTWSETYYNGQTIVMNSNETKPVVLYPEWWGISDLENQPTALLNFENADGTWQSFEDVIDERIGRISVNKSDSTYRPRKVRQTMQGAPTGSVVDEDDPVFIRAADKAGFQDVTYTVDGAREGGASYTMLKQKYPKQHYNERYAPDSKGSEVFTNRARGGANSKTPYVNTLMTQDILKHDKDEKLIPIRECFVNAEVVTTAFSEATNVRKALKKILDSINTDSGGLFNWQLKTGATDSELEVIDLNVTETELKKSVVNLTADSGFFKFNIMSPNSIVKDYNFELKTPSDSISNYYALQAMSHDSSLFPIDDNVGKALSALYGMDKDNMSILYEPDIGKYRLEQSLQRKNDTQLYNVYNTLKPIITEEVSHGTRAHKLIKSTETDALTSVELNEDGDKSNETKDDSARYNAQITQNDEQQTINGMRLVNNIREYLGMQSYIEDVSQLGVLMPYFLSLSTYGIASIAPGDTFQVDYLPEMYQSSSYVQTMKVSQKIDKSGWFTTLDTQFRIKGIDRAGSVGVANDDRTRLSAAWLQSLNLTPPKVKGDKETLHSYTARPPKDRSGKMDSLIAVMTDIKIKPNVISKVVSSRSDTKIAKESKGYIVTFKTARNLDGVDRRIDEQSAYAEFDSYFGSGKDRKLKSSKVEPARYVPDVNKRYNGSGATFNGVAPGKDELRKKLSNFTRETVTALQNQPSPPELYGRNTPYGEAFWNNYPNCKGWCISKDASFAWSQIGGGYKPTWQLAHKSSKFWTGGTVGEGWFKIPIVTDLYNGAKGQNEVNPFMFYSPWSHAQIYYTRKDYAGVNNYLHVKPGKKVFPPRVYLQPNTNYTMLIYGKSNAIFQDSLYTAEQLADLINFFSQHDNTIKKK